MRKIMIFGVFDGPHESHDTLLAEVRRHGDYVSTVVAQDHVVEHLFERAPRINFVERFEELMRTDGVDEVIIGSAGVSLRALVLRHRPDIVAFAADQKILKDDFLRELPKMSHRPVIRDLENIEFNSSHAGK